MKCTLLIIAALTAILSIAAQAHIGWSLSECRAKYGIEIKSAKATNSGEVHYFVAPAANLAISVIIRGDKVKSVIYQNTDGQVFSSSEIDILQKINQKEMLGCEGIEWEPVFNVPTGIQLWTLFRQGDGELQAILMGDSDQKFEIRTWDQIAVEKKAIQLDKLDQLKGI